jgi:hypothetical protein
MGKRIQIDERLVQEAASEITRLRSRLAQYEGDGVADAIQTSLQRPAQPDGGRNATVTHIVKAEIFTGQAVQKGRVGNRKREAADERKRQIEETFRKSRGRK